MRHSKIFSTDEVRSIMQGKMTAFYEVVKPQPIPPRAIYNLDEVEAIVSPTPNIMGGKTGVMFNWKSKKHPHITDGGFWTHIFPYSIGQKIYVREAWWQDKIADSYYYGSDNYCEEEMKTALQWGLKWQSPATMPREAARTWLEMAQQRGMRVTGFKQQTMPYARYHTA